MTWFGHPYLIAIETRDAELQHLFRHELQNWNSDLSFPAGICVAGQSGDVDTLRTLLSLFQGTHEEMTDLLKYAIVMAAEAGQQETLNVLLKSALHAGMFEGFGMRRLGFVNDDHHKVQTLVYF